MPERLVEALRQLNKDLGIPACLADVGVTEDKIPQMAIDAMKSGNVTVNPRLTTVKDVEACLLYTSRWPQRGRPPGALPPGPAAGGRG